MTEQHRHLEADKEETFTGKHTMLPGPVRTFSFVFFGVVVLIGVCGWLVSGGP